MTIIDVLREQLKDAHATIEATMEDVDDTVAHMTDTQKALPVGAAYAHAVLGEDMIVSTMLAHKKPLAEDTAQVGISELMPSMMEWEKHEAWAKTVKIHIPTLRAFAKLSMPHQMNTLHHSMMKM